MDSILETNGRVIIWNLVETIHINAALLSELDGAIGDGDHGINMDKGFLKTRKELEGKSFGIAEGLDHLGSVLFNDIGGAMGPIYGTFFMEMSDICGGNAALNQELFGKMLNSATQALLDLCGAKPGDKTLLDTLVPANQAFSQAIASGGDFTEALRKMQDAAEKGKESTRDLTARIGRASRLGERSRGVLDAGAVSCYLILHSIADSIIELLSSERSTT